MNRRMLDELLLNNPFFQQDCKCLLDKKAKARIKRENYQTWNALKCRERFLDHHAAEVQQGDDDGKDGATNDVEKQEDTTADYRFTRWSKSRMRRLRKEKGRWEEHLKQHKLSKFFTPLIKLRTTLLYQEWDRTCHLEERTIIQQNIRMHNIMRIRWKYNIDESLPSDNIIFTKLIKYEREKKKQAKLRQERMVKIVEKIAQEMFNGIRLLRKPKDVHHRKTKLKMINDENMEFSFEEILSMTDDSVPIQPLAAPDGAEMLKSKEHLLEMAKLQQKIESSTDTSTEDQSDIKGREVQISKMKINSEEIRPGKGLPSPQSSTDNEFPKDNCFFATPNVVKFEDFKLNKVYTRKVIITNKTVKWAYLRFHKVYIDVWEPGVVEINTMDAAKVKPGLTVPVNVIFTPVHEEEIKAEISFLTLNSSDTKTFHEFRVPVHCTPESAKPFVEPKDLKFPSAPIWKYSDPKINEKNLYITNKGGKSFSVVLEERNEDKNCFIWHFDQAVACSASSSIISLIDNTIVETNEGTVDEHTSDEQTARKLYQIEVPPKFTCNIRVECRPKYVGLQHEILEIYFVENGRLFDKQDIPLWAEVSGYQIHLDPPCIDLGVVMIDSDVCQQTFDIINTGRTTVNVLMKTPKCLRSQVSVNPKSTLVQPETFSKVSVRLIPESSISRIPKRFYDPVANILEFPVDVQILSQNDENPPPLSLKALASLTTCRGLVLEPACVDLGYVYTHESVYAELDLTNESLLTQEFAFFNLPSTIEIQPNYGFGTILPGETIKLHLIYSACLKDIPGNKIGANGISGERSFSIKVVTLAELAGTKKQSIINKLRNQWNTQSKIPISHGLPPPPPIEFKKSKTVAKREDGVNEDEADNPSNNLGNGPAISDERICEKEELVRMPIDRPKQPDTGTDKSSIDVFAYIIDTFCELSEQVVQLPATPCGSFSKFSIQLRGFNMASYPNCTCGIVKRQKKEFTARFEFHSSSDRVKITPLSGVLRSNEFTDIQFLFEPRLPRKMIFEEGVRLKMNIEEQRMKHDKGGKKGEGKKGTQKSPERIKDISDADKFAGENSLLELFEPCVSTIFVTCKINIEFKTGKKQDEMLFAKLICPITRPEIIVLNDHRDIRFGRSAVGVRSRKFLFVKNISNRTVHVKTTVLDPFGAFFVPPGRAIETGSILRLPVTYQPNQTYAEDQDYFEVYTANSNTRWVVKVSGHGVVPSYVLKPRFRVARIEVTGKSPVDVTMTMQNIGACSLHFRLFVIEVLEGNIPRPEDETALNTVRKKKKGVESTAESAAKVEFENTLRPEEELAIFGGNLQQSVDHSCFTFINVDENNQLTVPEKKKVEFGVRFQPREAESLSIRLRESAKSSSLRTTKSKETEKLNESQKSNCCHVALMKLMLGSTVVQSFVIICSTR